MSSQANGHVRPRRILVVDDDPMFREMMSHALSQQHMEVKVAQNGTEALEMIQSELFDLLLTDFHMPGMDGLEVAAAARRLNAALPIALLTGGGGTFSPVALRAAGINQLFPKPFDFAELMHWMHRHAPFSDEVQDADEEQG